MKARDRPFRLICGLSATLVLSAGLVTASLAPAQAGALSPPGPCSLSAARSGNDAALTWTAASGADGYHVYRDTTPYFAPALPYTTTSGLSYTDPGAIGDPGINYYYLVAAFNDAGETLCANRAGAFDYALRPGSGSIPDLQDIAYPLDASPAITDAPSLAASIGASVRQVLKWEPATQTFLAWSHEYQYGDRFPTIVGDYYFLLLDSTAPSVTGFVGLVPQPGDVRFALLPGTSAACLYNFLSLTLDRPDITNADQLSDDIGGVIQALDWDAPTQTFFAWSNEFGYGDNFATTIGYPYIVCLGPEAPNEDAYVSLNNPNGAYGTTDPNYLQAQASRLLSAEPCTTTRYMYLKFAASPLVSDTTTATLTLKNAQYSGPAAGVTLGLYAAVNDGWSEDTLTWNNRPAVGDLLGQASASEIVGHSQIVFSTNAAFVNHINAQRTAGDGLVSLVVGWADCPAPSAPQLRVYSSEGADAPDLVLLTPLPAPLPRLIPFR